MTVYANAESALNSFERACGAALADKDFAATVNENGISLHFVCSAPGFEFFVRPDGVAAGVPCPVTLRLELSADTAHEIFLGRLPVPQAIVAGRLVIKGPVAKVRLLAELLPVLGREYAGVVTGVRAA